MQDSDKPTI